MAKFLIEVPHSEQEQACVEVVRVFLSTGSHFLAQAEWGCLDGVHSAWFFVETETRDEARLIVPPAFREQAKIVGLNRFSMAQIAPIMARHRHAAD